MFGHSGSLAAADCYPAITFRILFLSSFLARLRALFVNAFEAGLGSAFSTRCRMGFFPSLYSYFFRALRTKSLVYESAGFRLFASLTAGSKPISTLSCASTPAGGNSPSLE